MTCTIEHGNLLLTVTKVTIDRGNPLYSVTPVMSWKTDLLGADHRIHDNWVAYFRTWSRRSWPQSYGRAQTCRNQSSVWSSRKLLHVTLKVETKNLRSDIFAQVNLISAAPTLQNLRISLRMRQSGKSKVPAKQRGSRPKISKKMKEKHKAALILPSEIGACLHQLLNLRNENLLSTPARRCIWSAKWTWMMLKWILWRNRVVLR